MDGYLGPGLGAKVQSSPLVPSSTLSLAVGSAPSSLPGTQSYFLYSSLILFLLPQLSPLPFVMGSNPGLQAGSPTELHPQSNLPASGSLSLACNIH